MSERERITTVVVGLGGMGGSHARTIKALDEGDLVAGVEIDSERAKRASEKLGIPVYATISECIDKAKPRAAVVATQPAHHAGPTVELLERDIPVLCEKPMALTEDDCRRMLTAERTSKGFLKIGFEVRTCPFVLAARKVIDAGEIGEIVSMNFMQTPGLKRAGNWHIRRETAGGLFTEKLCHQLDLFRMFLGEPVDVTVFRARNVLTHYEIPDNVQVAVRFPDGKLAHITFIVGRAAVDVSEERFADAGHFLEYLFIGTGGSLSINYWQRRILVTRLVADEAGGVHTAFDREITFGETNAASLYESVVEQNREFLRCVATGEAPAQSAEDAFATMKAVFAAEKAVENPGQAVPVS